MTHLSQYQLSANMNRLKKSLTSLLTGAIAISLSSCSFLTAANDSDSSLAQSTPSPVEAEKSQPLTPGVSQVATPIVATKTLSVNVYQPDSQCQALVPETVQVPAGTPLQAAVGKVLEQRDTADFSLAGYRVSINSRRVATVDLRVTPGSKRKFVSLSTCEQFALFGSLRKTLTSNPALKIKDVRFTEQGREIYL